MPKGKIPTYKGKVCDENRQELGTIALWEQSKDERKSEKSPILRGEIVIDAKIVKTMTNFDDESFIKATTGFDDKKIKMRIALWPNGKVEVSSG